MNTPGTDSFYSSEEFQSFFKLSGQSLVLKANLPHFKILAASDNYLSLTHKQRSEILNLNLFEVFPGDGADPSQKFSVFSSFQRVIQTKAADILPTFSYQIFVPRLGKMVTEYWSNVNEPLLDKAGNVAYIINTTANITEKIVSQHALKEAKEQARILEREQAMNEELAVSNEELNASNDELIKTQGKLQDLIDHLEEKIKERTLAVTEREEKLKLAIETGKMATWRIDPVTLEVTMSDYIKEIFGLPVDKEVEMEAIIGAVHPPYRQPLTDVLTNAILHHKPSDIEYPITNYKTGETKWVRATGKVFFDKEGTISEYSGLLMDTTEQAQAREYLKHKFEHEHELNEELGAINEELTQSQNNMQLLIADLAESEAKLRSIIEQAPIAINVFKTRDLVIDMANDRMLEIWNKTPDVIGKPVALALPELKEQPFLQLLNDVITTGNAYYGYENKAMVQRNNEWAECYFNLIYQPIRDEKGNLASILHIANEVTEQVTARKEVQKANEMTNLAIEAAKLGTWHINPKNMTLRYNATLATIFGYEGEEDMTYEQAIAQVTDDYKFKIVNEINKAITEGGDYDITYTQRRFNDGAIIWLRSIGKINQSKNGEFNVFSGFVMDITEQKQDEQRKNDFIGMVSHEMKTPLTSLSGYLQFLQVQANNNKDSFTEGLLERANKQVGKMTTLINGFLNVSRLEAGKIQIDKQRFDMAALVKETKEDNLTTVTSHRLIFAPVEETFVMADKDKIAQVIDNLISNAVKYSAPGSTIQVACVTFDGKVQVSVKDEGIGIQPQDMDKLFDRYYRVESTRHISGFGIGLYLCKEIIDRHNGAIWAESEEGNGTTFFFTLPVLSANE